MSVFGKKYNMEEDLKGELYCTLASLCLTMPGKKLTKDEYKPTNCLQYCSYELNPIIYGNMLDSIVHELESPFLDKHKKKYVQQVLGSVLYYTHTIGMTILHALSSIAPEQAKPYGAHAKTSTATTTLHTHKPNSSHSFSFIRHDTKHVL